MKKTPFGTLRHDRRGFTLIELVIVIVVLGILATQAIPTYLSLVDDAKKAAGRANLGALRSAVTVYYAYKATPMGGQSATWPSITQLTDNTTVLQGQVPDNSYDGDATKNNIVTGTALGVLSGAAGGWAYVPSNGLLWVNTSTGGVSENGW